MKPFVGLGLRMEPESPPTRGRGLKLIAWNLRKAAYSGRPPRGGVD